MLLKSTGLKVVVKWSSNKIFRLVHGTRLGEGYENRESELKLEELTSILSPATEVYSCNTPMTQAPAMDNR